MASALSETSPLATQLSHPYLSQNSIDELLSMQRNGKPYSETKELQIRLTACSWMQSISQGLQFPVRTLGTAMMIYHRFHLFHPIADFNTNDVSTACIFVASKMEDTAKKARDILVVAYAVRNPLNPEINPESPVLEDQRRRILGLERMILETQSFDFRHRHPQPFIIKFARSLRLTERQTKQAWSISVDSYRTWTPLKLPPHATALACLMLATKIDRCELEVDPARFEVDQAHLDVALEDLLDLYLHFKSCTSAVDICTEEQLMEIKSGLLKDQASGSADSNGRHHATIEKPENVSSIGDRGTCRYILDPGRLDMSATRVPMDTS